MLERDKRHVHGGHSIQIAMGIVTYIFLFRYRLGRTSYQRQMLFARLFVACFAVEQVLEVALTVLLGGFEPYAFSYYLFGNLAIVSSAVACLFTLRRLRR